MAEPRRTVTFSPPDVSPDDIDAVAEALRSGWITTGPRTKEFERAIAAKSGAARAATFSSATMALECALRALGSGPGDEVITSAYTYTASCSCICHVGATPVLCDVAPGSYEMDYEQLASLVTKRTRAVIPVDIAGRMVDYRALFTALEGAARSGAWHPAGRSSLAAEAEAAARRPLVLSDGAHSFGAAYDGAPSGSVADLTAFSFHAVKNLTTAEGGALAWRKSLFPDEELYRQLMLLSLHGQTKDALAKTAAGSWEYDIAFPGYKCNMTDLQAALGLSQLQRYDAMVARRHAIVAAYEQGLADLAIEVLAHEGSGSGVEAPFRSSAHLMLTRLVGADEAFRNRFIEQLADRGVAANVHYKPLPLLTAYRNLGFDAAAFPNALAQYRNEVTLPLHTSLSDEDVAYVIEAAHGAYGDAQEAR